MWGKEPGYPTPSPWENTHQHPPSLRTPEEAADPKPNLPEEAVKNFRVLIRGQSQPPNPPAVPDADLKPLTGP